MEHVKPRWVRRYGGLVRVYRGIERWYLALWDDGVTWLAWRAKRNPWDLSVSGEFKSKHEAKLWVQREERVWP